jgi:nicotinamidase-related amidase
VNSEAVRDPSTDHLLTSENAALLVIDYQPIQLEAVRSMSQHLLVDNIVSVVRLARAFELPIVLSTINVAAGQKPTIPELREWLLDTLEIDRTKINAWEDTGFHRAVTSTGRTNLIMTALWTEASMALPALDALREGYGVYLVVDAVGGTSQEAHRAALQRVMGAGGQPISWLSLACELQRDWARTDTLGDVVDIVWTAISPDPAADDL